MVTRQPVTFWRGASCSLAPATIWAPSEQSRSLHQLNVFEVTVSARGLSQEHIFPLDFSISSVTTPFWLSWGYKMLPSSIPAVGITLPVSLYWRGWSVYSFFFLVHGRTDTGRFVPQSLTPRSIYLLLPPVPALACSSCLWALPDLSQLDGAFGRTCVQGAILSVPVCCGEMAGCVFLPFMEGPGVALWALQGCIAGTTLPVISFCPTDTPMILWIAWAVTKQRIIMEEWWASSPSF